MRLLLLTLGFSLLGTAALADCTSPAGPAGRIDYFPTENVFKYCDGTNWNIWAGQTVTGGDPPTGGGGGDSLPTGAVMAFNLATCPTGWSALTAAVGRSIVGVGTYAANADDDGSNSSINYTLASTGGRVDHALSTAQMPAHTHSIGVGAGSTPNNDTFGTNAATTGSSTSGSAGSGSAHENRPPYLALLYCEKD